MTHLQCLQACFIESAVRVGKVKPTFYLELQNIKFLQIT